MVKAWNSQISQLKLDKPLGGRYHIVGQLGEGGFSHTFLAADLHLPGHPRCVIKHLKPRASDTTTLNTARRLFETEAQVLYQLGNHDQIPRLLAHFEDNREFYLAMELVEGNALRRELVEGQPWPEVRVIAMLWDILQALAFVHQQNVIHRDIKPANLIRRSCDGKIVLIDFGAVKQATAQLANPNAEPTVTITIGTQGYMANEQLAGTPRFSSDVYSVGIIGIQALTGVKPRNFYHDPRTGELEWQEHATQASSEVRSILASMVRYHFKERYPTAADALRVLHALLQERPDLAAAIATPPSLERSALGKGYTQAFSTLLQPSGVLSKQLQVPDVKLPLVNLPNPPQPTLATAKSALTSFSQVSQSLRFVPWKTSVGAGMVVAATLAVIPNFVSHTPQPVVVTSPIASLPCNEPSLPPLPSGAPDYEYANGSKYYGPLQEQHPADGRGSMTFQDGARYNGEFRDGMRNGCGTLKFVDGRSYVGQFQDDEFNGLGLWKLENGDRYIGEFRDNRCNGEGIFIFANGRSQNGTWRDGKLVGGNLSCDGGSP
jgi:serine/threonine protein kinase